MKKSNNQSNATNTTLDSKTFAKGISRKATDEELIEYLKKGINAKRIPLEIAFSKYINSKTKNSPNH